MILGVSCGYHDAAAALCVDGRLVAAASEARFSRIKHDPAFPERAIRSCLATAGLEADAVTAAVYYEKPLLKLERALDTAMATAPRGWHRFVDGVPRWVRQDARIRTRLRRSLGANVPVYFSSHHTSHASAAFFASPLEEAAILTVDGVGEWETATIGHGRGPQLEPLRALRFPDSVGLLYAAFTELLGFRVNNGEYKVMGLAPYGRPRFAERILAEVVQVFDDGSIRLNPDAFSFLTGTRTASDVLRQWAPTRRPDAPILDEHRDLARSIQHVVELILLRQAAHAMALTGSRNLVMAGGVALNSVANGRIRRELAPDRLWIQPASGDAGGAVGAALWLRHQVFGCPRTEPSPMGHALLGPAIGAPPEHPAVDATWLGPAWVDKVADTLAEGGVVAVAQGRMELGPRALGARSILADPRRADMKDRINARVKFREGFRPFAPMVRQEARAAWFETEASLYMTEVVPVHPSHRDAIPSVTHVDGSARVQVVPPDHPIDPLLRAFEARTGCPVLLNTSFNLKGEPIVCTAAHAIDTFLACDLDGLAVGEWWITRRTPERVPLPAPPQPLAEPVEALRSARIGAGLLALAGAVVALLGSLAGAVPLVGMGALVLLATVVAPRGVERADHALRPWAERLSRAQVWLLVRLLYGGMVLPIALVRQRVADPLRRSWGAPDTASTWGPPESVGPPDRMY